MLHDITACDEISHTSHCICRYTVAVFEVCKEVQAGRFYHERQQCLPRKRRGVENPCTFLMGKSPKPSSKWLQDNGKLKIMACIHSFPDKVVSTRMSYFCWYEPVQVPTVTNCCPFLLDSWRHTWTIDKKIVHYFQRLFDVEDVNTDDWRETKWCINCRAILCINCN